MLLNNIRNTIAFHFRDRAIEQMNLGQYRKAVNELRCANLFVNPDLEWRRFGGHLLYLAYMNHQY